MRGSIISRVVFNLLVLACIETSCRFGFAAEKVSLQELPTDSRVFRVTSQLSVAGDVLTSSNRSGKAAAVKMKLGVEAKFVFSERRLDGAGRDEKAFRSIRYYDQAASRVVVSDKQPLYVLRDAVRMLVASGQREGIQLHSPAGPLTYDELELLRSPCDSLAALALLPDQPVESGDTWKPSDWVLQMLTGMEAMEKSQLECKLDSIQTGSARVTFSGEISGANRGAATTCKVDGSLTYDLTRKFVQRIDWTQTEKASDGTVSPGLDAIVKVVCQREPQSTQTPLASLDVSQFPIEPDPGLLLLAFESKEWGVRFHHDRHWHVFMNTPRVAVLRLLDSGSLIAQCNVTQLASATPGKHVPEDQFQADVQKAIGKNFSRILEAQPLENTDKRFVYRVMALGTVSRGSADKEEAVPMQWIYYLIADASGRQMSLVFTLETQLIDKLADRDLQIIGGWEFHPLKLPTPAAATNRK